MSDGSIRLNIGSGQRPFNKPWVNIDSQERWSPDIVASGDKLTMFEDNSVSVVVLHHVLEHFGCGEGLPLLQECRRVLKALGRIYVYVPNMRALAQMWLNGAISDQIYMTNVYGAYMGSEDDRHKWGYTYHTLTQALGRAGFKYFDSAFTMANAILDLQGASIAEDNWILGIGGFKV